jgi:hypothetical protein
MPLELKTAPGRLGRRPAGGYKTTATVHDTVTGEPVAIGTLRLANTFTAPRSTMSEQAKMDRAKPMTGKSGAVSKSDPVLAAKSRVIIPTTGRFQLQR